MRLRSGKVTGAPPAPSNQRDDAERTETGNMLRTDFTGFTPTRRDGSPDGLIPDLEDQNNSDKNIDEQQGGDITNRTKVVKVPKTAREPPLSNEAPRGIGREGVVECRRQGARGRGSALAKRAKTARDASPRSAQGEDSSIYGRGTGSGRSRRGGRGSQGGRGSAATSGRGGRGGKQQSYRNSNNNIAGLSRATRTSSQTSLHGRSPHQQQQKMQDQHRCMCGAICTPARRIIESEEEQSDGRERGRDSSLRQALAKAASTAGTFASNAFSGAFGKAKATRTARLSTSPRRTTVVERDEEFEQAEQLQSSDEERSTLVELSGGPSTYVRDEEEVLKGEDAAKDESPVLRQIYGGGGKLAVAEKEEEKAEEEQQLTSSSKAPESWQEVSKRLSVPEHMEVYDGSEDSDRCSCYTSRRKRATTTSEQLVMDRCGGAARETDQAGANDSRSHCAIFPHHHHSPAAKISAQLRKGTPASHRCSLHSAFADQKAQREDGKGEGSCWVSAVLREQMLRSMKKNTVEMDAAAKQNMDNSASAGLFNASGPNGQRGGYTQHLTLLQKSPSPWPPLPRPLKTSTPRSSRDGHGSDDNSRKSSTEKEESDNNEEEEERGEKKNDSAGAHRFYGLEVIGHIFRVLIDGKQVWPEKGGGAEGENK